MIYDYDLIFAGGGLAGLSLAYALSHSALRERSILIVEREDKLRSDRTWCFWTNRPTMLDSFVQREYKQIEFIGDVKLEIPLHEYGYKVIRGADFFRRIQDELARIANVEFVQGTVDYVEDRGDGAIVSVGDQQYSGKWVFDSRFNLKAFRPDPERYHCLWQHFKGWEIETPAPAFNPTAATLLDFRTPQKRATRFFYVLPFSPSRALVEYVTTGQDDYDKALKEYVEETLELRDYRIVSKEGGVSPMTDYIFPRAAGRHVMNIGVHGGRLKATTGYALARILRDSDAIVRSLIDNGHPFAVRPDSRRYRLYDSLLLQIMQEHGKEIKPIFTALFKNNPISRVLRFLDEEGSAPENVLLIASLPPRLFLHTLAQRKTLARLLGLGRTLDKSWAMHAYAKIEPAARRNA